MQLISALLRYAPVPFGLMAESGLTPSQAALRIQQGPWRPVAAVLDQSPVAMQLALSHSAAKPVSMSCPPRLGAPPDVNSAHCVELPSLGIVARKLCFCDVVDPVTSLDPATPAQRERIVALCGELSVLPEDVWAKVEGSKAKASVAISDLYAMRRKQPVTGLRTQWYAQRGHLAGLNIDDSVTVAMCLEAMAEAEALIGRGEPAPVGHRLSGPPTEMQLALLRSRHPPFDGTSIHNTGCLWASATPRNSAYCRSDRDSERQVSHVGRSVAADRGGC